jgi:hypothetical protein
MNGGEVSGNSASSSSSPSPSYLYSSYGGGVYVGGGTFTMNGGEVTDNSSSSSSYSSYGGGVYVGGGTFTMSGGEVTGNILSGTRSYGREVLVGGTFKMSGDARPERVFLDNNTLFITISGDLSGGTVPIDLGVGSSLTNWVYRPVLALDSSYSSGNLADLKEHFTLGNAKMTNSPYTETAIPTNYTVGIDGKIWDSLLPPPPDSGISNITYSSVSGGTWTLESDGRRKSPSISHNGITKARVSFTSTAADVNITIALDVSSEANYDYAFISTLDNGSATSSSGYYTGSLISGTASVTVTIPVPTPGSHFIEIGYQKDGSQTGGSDCAWFEVVE